MNEKTVSMDYTKSLMYELEKAFWDERGKGARFRMMTVGRVFFKEKCWPLLQSSDLKHIL